MMKFLGLLKINDNNHYFIVHQVITKGLTQGMLVQVAYLSLRGNLL